MHLFILMNVLFICLSSMHFYIMFMGLILPEFIDVDASSPPSKGWGHDSREGDASFCWVCRCFRSQARSSVGVHSSVVELTRLVVQAF